MTMFVCEKCGKETPSNESYISEDGFRICEECAQNTNAIKDDYIEIEETTEETQNEENEASKAEQEPVKPQKLSKEERKLQKKRQLQEEKERKLNEERQQILESRRKYAEAKGLYVGDLTIDELREWNDIDATIVAAYLNKLFHGPGSDAVYNTNAIQALNSQIIVRQNEEIIRLLRALLEK